MKNLFSIIIFLLLSSTIFAQTSTQSYSPNGTATNVKLDTLNAKVATKDKQTYQIGQTVQQLVRADTTNARLLKLTAKPTIGANVPTVTDFTGAGTITVTNTLCVILENTGVANGSFVYGGKTYTIYPGEQRKFEAILDQTKGKYSPLAALTVTGTGTNIRVVQVLTQ
jgi:hypothetical protein